MWSIATCPSPPSAIFCDDLYKKKTSIKAVPENNEEVGELVWEISKKNITRGCRKLYVSYLNDDSKEVYERYTKAYNVGLFSDKTL